MRLSEFSAVRLVTDDYAGKGVSRGAIGFILEAHSDGYVVEFSRPDGTTIAWFAVRPDDVEPAPEVMTPTPVRSSM